MTKNEILKILVENEGFVSGEEISKKLFISRVAVWKGVKMLKKEGYIIESSTNKGYMLLKSPDILNEEIIAQKIKDTGFFVRLFDMVDSTNKIAKALANDGAKEGLVVLSEGQQKGRGRFSRSFESHYKKGVFMSIILKPKCYPEEFSIFTVLIAVCVLNVIKKNYKIDAKIKWTNDIVINSKKVCGILTELSTDVETFSIQYAVIGIGINANQDAIDFSSEINNIATSIKLECGKEICRNELISQILIEIEKYYKNGEFLFEKDKLILDYKNNLSMLNKEIKFMENDKEFYGTAIDANNDGGLLVRLLDGTTKTLKFGEISIKNN